jgi:hypothetical protein
VGDGLARGLADVEADVEAVGVELVVERALHLGQMRQNQISFDPALFQASPGSLATSWSWTSVAAEIGSYSMLGGLQVDLQLFVGQHPPAPVRFDVSCSAWA